MSRQKVLACPYCGVTTVFVLRKSEADPLGRPGRDTQHFAALYSCSNDKCQRVIYLRTGCVNINGQLGPDPDSVLEQFPRRAIRLEEGIPEGDIADDFIEAQRCYDIGAARASAAMCRRSLQAAAVRLRASPKKKLMDQIDELDITQQLKEWAHQVRVIGNAGAHPDKDGLEDVNPEDARDAILFTEEFYNYVFVMPERVSKRQGSKSPPLSGSE